MSYVVVYTDKGEQVWQTQVTALSLRRLECPGNSIGAAFAAMLRGAVTEAEKKEEESG